MSADLLRVLRTIKSNGDWQMRRNQGICGNVRCEGVYYNTTMHGSNLEDQLSELFITLGVHPAYPVPGGEAQYEYEQEHLTLWSNPDRLALLDRCIAHLEARYEQAVKP